MAWDALRWGDLLESQLPPRRLEGLAGQECNGGLALAFTALVAPMVMVKHEQIEGRLGDLSFATIERGPNERIDHLDERGGPDNRVELVEHQGCKGITLVANEPCGACQPALAFSVMIALGRCGRLRGEMLMVPREDEKCEGLVRYDGPECRINGFGLGKRDDQVIERRTDGREGGGNGGAVEFGKPVDKPCQCRSDVLLGAQSAMRRASLACCTQYVQQYGQVVGECHGLLAGVMRGVIVVQALVEMRLACGTRKLLHGVVCLLNGRIGLAFHSMQDLKEVAKRVEIIRHPQGHVARGLVAGHEAQAPIRGQA